MRAVLEVEPAAAIGSRQWTQLSGIAHKMARNQELFISPVFVGN
jgi:hypothetical protein